jgi:hypothetical protein
MGGENGFLSLIVPLPQFLREPMAMPTDLENLLTRRTTILAELAALTPSASGGKPTYSLDGQHVDHTRYRLSLYEELAAIDRQLVTLQGPFEERSRGIT